jgi:hypothetical protein
LLRCDPQRLRRVVASLIFFLDHTQVWINGIADEAMIMTLIASSNAPAQRHLIIDSRASSLGSNGNRPCHDEQNLDYRG